MLHTLPTAQQPATFGLADESARLNINSLPLEPTRRKESRNRLLQLPQMTNHIADAILDWMDADDDASEYGAESSWYSTQSPPYRPAQTRFKSLNELLLVRGVSNNLLFGEDRNQNGILDPGEDTNSDGVLQFGLSEYLTVHSAESTLAADGSRKLNVNSDNLASLYDNLEVAFDSRIAAFIVAMRMSGPDETGKPKKQLTEEEKRIERQESANRRLAQQLGAGAADEGGLATLARSDNVQTQSRGGMLLSATPPHKIESLVDLIGSIVRINVNNEDTLLKSPWDSDPSSIDKALRTLSGKLTLTNDRRLIGRINVSQAPYEVLMTIPEMTESLARSITRARQRTSDSSRSSISKNRKTIAWLVQQGLVDIHRLRQMAPFITDQGDVSTGVSIGHIDGIRSTSAIRFVVDATSEHPRLLSLQDLPPMPNPISRPRETSAQSQKPAAAKKNADFQQGFHR